MLPLFTKAALYTGAVAASYPTRMESRAVWRTCSLLALAAVCIIGRPHGQQLWSGPGHTAASRTAKVQDGLPSSLACGALSQNTVADCHGKVPCCRLRHSAGYQLAQLMVASCKWLCVGAFRAGILPGQFLSTDGDNLQFRRLKGASDATCASERCPVCISSTGSTQEGFS